VLRRAGFGVVALVACGGAAELPEAAFDAVCGAAGPFRVLELAPGERLAGPPRAIDGRVVIRVGTYEAIGIGATPPLKEAWLWSTGPCGEAPVRLDPTLEDVLALELWPGLLFGRRVAEGELVVLDATAEDAGHVAFAGLGPSPLYWTEHGLVSFEARDEATGAALLHRFPGDPRTDTETGSVVVEGVRIAVDEDRVFAYDFRPTPDELFVWTVDHEVVRVALADGAAKVEETNVKAGDASPDGRWLLWQRLVGDPEDPETPGAVFLRDLTSGAEVGLGDGYLDNTFLPFQWYAYGLFVVNIEPYADRKQRVHRLDTLEFTDLPDDRALLHVFADGRWAIGRLYNGGVELFDPADGSVTPLVDRGSVEWWGEDAFEVVDLGVFHGGDSYTDEGALFRVPLEGSPRRLAERVSRAAVRQSDGRWFTGLDLDASRRGSLVVIDPEAEGSTRVDERVFASTMRLTTAFGEEALVYSVDDGERTGVWLARVVGG
jgi:hypothetical protein